MQLLSYYWIINFWSQIQLCFHQFKRLYWTDRKHYQIRSLWAFILLFCIKSITFLKLSHWIIYVLFFFPFSFWVSYCRSPQSFQRDTGSTDVAFPTVLIFTMCMYLIPQNSKWDENNSMFSLEDHLYCLKCSPLYIQAIVVQNPNPDGHPSPKGWIFILKSESKSSGALFC